MNVKDKAPKIQFELLSKWQRVIRCIDFSFGLRASSCLQRTHTRNRDASSKLLKHLQVLIGWLFPIRHSRALLKPFPGSDPIKCVRQLLSLSQHEFMLKMRSHAIWRPTNSSAGNLFTLIQCSQVYAGESCASACQIQQNFLGQLAKLESHLRMESENLHTKSVCWSRTTARIGQLIKLSM